MPKHSPFFDDLIPGKLLTENLFDIDLAKQKQPCLLN